MLKQWINKLQDLNWQRYLSWPVLLIYMVTLGVYLANGRGIAFVDTSPARHLIMSVIREGDLKLNEVRDYTDVLELWFVVKEIDGDIISHYPVGVVFLGLPYYLIGMLIGLAPDQLDGLAKLEKFAAANIGALLAALFWVLLRRRTDASLTVRLIIWLTMVFGTSNWVQNSQGLWQHTPLQICEVLALLALPRTFAGRHIALRVAVAGVMLGLAGFMRPTGYILIPVWGLYLLWKNWRMAFPFTAGAIAGCLPQLAYNFAYIPRGDGGYFALIFGNDFFKTLTPFWNMTGLLFSPNRGLVIFTPIVILLLLWPLKTVRQKMPPNFHPVLLAMSGAAIFGIYLGFKIWWQGWTYSPRFMTDLMPFLMLLMVPPVKYLLSKPRKIAVPASLFIGVTMIWSIGVQALGAWRYDGAWDNRTAIAAAHDVAWDWHDNIIRDVWSGNENPRTRKNSPDYYALEPGKFYNFGLPESNQFIWSGFYVQEGWGTWTRGMLPGVMLMHFPEGEGNLYLAAMGTGSEYAPARFTIYLNGHRVRKEAEISKNAFHGWDAEVVKIPLKKKHLTGGIEHIKIISHDGMRASPTGRFYGMGIKQLVYLPTAMEDQETSVVEQLDKL